MNNSLFYKPDNSWGKYDSPESRQKLQSFANEYLSFLSQCKTERETAAWVEKRLAASGFSKEFPTDKIMRPMRGKSLFAAKRGNRPINEGFLLIAAHGDSPRLDFKQHPIIEQDGLVLAKTHYYGGIRKYQWLARPLALHGTILLATGKKINVTIGEDPEDPVFCISDLLPHLAKKQLDKKISEAFEGEKLNIILGSEPAFPESDNEIKETVKFNILTILHDRYGIKEEDLITAELQAVPAGPARFTGIDRSMTGGYGQDDRICVFCAVHAFIEAAKTDKSQALIIWDKEEIGSEGATGAASRFLEYCLQDTCRQWGQAEFSEVLLNTCAVSADVTAAIDPEFPEVYDKNNDARLGYGPCFSKYTGSGGKMGANDADAEYYAALRNLFNERQIPWQAAGLGKVDAGGGGTVALFLAAYGLNVIDLGPALLSMHSPFEISSTVDLYSTFQAYKCFLESQIKVS